MQQNYIRLHQFSNQTNHQGNYTYSWWASVKDVEQQGRRARCASIADVGTSARVYAHGMARDSFQAPSCDDVQET